MKNIRDVTYKYSMVMYNLNSSSSCWRPQFSSSRKNLAIHAIFKAEHFKMKAEHLCMQNFLLNLRLKLLLNLRLKRCRKFIAKFKSLLQSLKRKFIAKFKSLLQSLKAEHLCNKEIKSIKSRA